MCIYIYIYISSATQVQTYKVVSTDEMNGALWESVP